MFQFRILSGHKGQMAYMAEYNFLCLKFFEVNIFSDFRKNVLIQFRQEFDFLFFLNLRNLRTGMLQLSGIH